MDEGSDYDFDTRNYDYLNSGWTFIIKLIISHVRLLMIISHMKIII